MKSISKIVPLFFITFLFFFSSCSRTQREEPIAQKSYGQWAVVVVPVADVLSTGPATTKYAKKGKKRYKNLPLSYPYHPDYHASRVHQLLFNQLVRVTGERDGEITFEVPNLLVQSSAEKEAKAFRGWTLRENLVMLQKLQEAGADLALFPSPFPHRQKRKVATLRFPKRIEKYKTTFSAGTRFVVTNEGKEAVQLSFYNPKRMRQEIISLPKKILLFNDSRKGAEERVDDFLRLLKLWANPSSGFIPYVLGGASWTSTCTEKNGITRTKIYDDNGKPLSKNGKVVKAYDRKEMPSLNRSGFDCSSLIYTAAQAAGLPYFCKNTTTITQLHRRFEKGDQLERGDLVWRSGHVFIIGEVSPKLTLIQAKGYASTYGKVMEKEVSKLFQKIKSPKDLVALHLSGKPLKTLTRWGRKGSSYKNWGIYKLRKRKRKPPLLFEYEKTLTAMLR